MIDLGFDTVGNATLIAYDRGPVLVTDPWIEGSAYFGSWSLSHAIPAEQYDAARAAPFVWFSHGHPDHLNPESLPLFRSRRILLPDHVGGRIATQLRRGGFDVQILKHAAWTQLSERIRVLCVADSNQDAILLIDLDGRLIVDLNDAQNTGWGPLVRRTVKQYPVSFLLRLRGFGDADMINFVDESGTHVPSVPEIRKASGFSVGASAARNAEAFGTTYFVPFSSLHRYQRDDSVWANACVTDLGDYIQGFESSITRLLPAFIRYDAGRDDIVELTPQRASDVVLSPAAFGDDWSEELESPDVDALREYFCSVDHLAKHMDFVNLRVGGRDHRIELGRSRAGRGVTFAAPRASLMNAVQLSIFDDLLIGNFMKTTLHGKWPRSGLYPEFTPYVAKYADNGLARSDDEVRRYFAEYRRRIGAFQYVRGLLERHARRLILARAGHESNLSRVARDMYYRTRGLR